MNIDLVWNAFGLLTIAFLLYMFYKGKRDG